MRSLIAAFSLIAAAPAMAQDTRPAQTAASPDGRIVLTVSTDTDERLTWSLSRKGKLLIAPSKLGFMLTDGIGLQRGFRIDGAETGSADEKWELPWGERRFVRNHYNELLVRFRQHESWGGHAINVRFRLFDDGVGFRYELPEQAGLKTARIADEVTEFDIAPEGTAWWITRRRMESLRANLPEDADRCGRHRAHADHDAPRRRHPPRVPRGGARRLFGHVAEACRGAQVPLDAVAFVAGRA